MTKKIGTAGIHHSKTYPIYLVQSSQFSGATYAIFGYLVKSCQFGIAYRSTCRAVKLSVFIPPCVMRRYGDGVLASPTTRTKWQRGIVSFVTSHCCRLHVIFFFFLGDREHDTNTNGLKRWSTNSFTSLEFVVDVNFVSPILFVPRIKISAFARVCWCHSSRQILLHVHSPICTCFVSITYSLRTNIGK